MERTIYAVSRRACHHAPTRSSPRPASNPFAHPSHPSHPSHTFHTPSDSTPAQHPLHNSHAIPRGANLDRPHKPRNSAIVDSTFERLTGKLHATLWGNRRRNAGGQGAAEPRTRRRSFARRRRRLLLPVGQLQVRPQTLKSQPLLPVGQLRTRPSSSARPAPTAGRTAPDSRARRCRCASSSADRPRTHRARPGAGAPLPRRACDRSPGSPATGG